MNPKWNLYVGFNCVAVCNAVRWSCALRAPTSQCVLCVIFALVKNTENALIRHNIVCTFHRIVRSSGIILPSHLPCAFLRLFAFVCIYMCVCVAKFRCRAESESMHWDRQNNQNESMCVSSSPCQPNEMCSTKLTNHKYRITKDIEIATHLENDCF